MNLDAAALRHIARLARLELPDAELEAIRTRLQAVLEHVDQLRKLDVADVPPLDHAVDLTSVRRDDEPRDGISPEAALANAPSVAGPYFAVPRIIDAP